MMPIVWNLTNDNLDRLHELLSNLLQAVEVAGATNVKGLITTKADYKAAHAGITFYCLVTPLKAYNPAILLDATMTNCMGDNCEWMANLLCQLPLRAG